MENYGNRKEEIDSCGNECSNWIMHDVKNRKNKNTKGMMKIKIIIFDDLQKKATDLVESF